MATTPPRRSKPQSSADRLAKALAELPPQLIDVDTFGALLATTKDPDFQRWLYAHVREIEAKLGHTLLGPLLQCVSERAQIEDDGTRKWLEFFFRTRGYWAYEIRVGSLVIAGAPKFDRMVIVYVSHNKISMRFGCSLSLDVRISSNTPSERSILVGRYPISWWSAWLTFPIEIVNCWLGGQIEDPDISIQLYYVDSMAVQYADCPPCPLALLRLFRDLGRDAIEQLCDIGCLEPETAEAITRRIAELRSRSTERALEQREELGKAQPESPDRPSTGSDRLLALRTSEEDIERLKKIEGDAFLTTRQLMRLLGFQSTSGPSSFLHRMLSSGLITTEMGPDGIGVKVTLTEKGKRVLSALQ